MTPVVVATKTVRAGLIVRWYRTLDAAQAHRPVLTASQKGVQVHGEVWLHDLPGEWLEAAKGAHEALRAGDTAKARGLATHQVKGFMSGDLVPVEGKTGE